VSARRGEVSMKKKMLIAWIVCFALSGAMLTYILAQTLSSSSNSDDWERLNIERFEDDFENWMFMFDSDRHEVVSPEWHGSRMVVDTFEEAHRLMRRASGAIIIGEVAGPSINRITDPAIRPLNVTTADNHVITPILVHYIMHVGDEITNIRIGEIIDVIEGYSYVTPETRAYQRGTPIGTVITNRGAVPMEVGNRYILHLFGITGETAHYNGEQIVHAAQASQVFPLNPQAPIREVPGQPHVAEWHAGMLALYGHLYSIPSPTSRPLPEPANSSEVHIITQGSRELDIYDSMGNRLVREGRNLYREVNGSRVQAGQRIPISQAMRRFHYILEFDEYILRNMEFTNGIATEITTIVFDDWLFDSIVRYNDFQGSSHLELITSPAITNLSNTLTRMVIEPTEIASPAMLRELNEATGRHGWVHINNNWYLYNHGTHLLGWQIPEGDTRWFFLDPRLDGAMLTGIVTLPGGDTHEFAPNGVWIRQVIDRNG